MMRSLTCFLLSLVGGAVAEGNGTAAAGDAEVSTRQLTFFGCACDDVGSVFGDSRPYEHRCTAVGHNFADTEVLVRVILDYREPNLFYVTPDGELSRSPDFSTMVAPSAAFSVTFTLPLEISALPVGRHLLAYELMDKDLDKGVQCPLNHEQLPADTPLITSSLFTLSDFMGSLNGPDNFEDPLEYPVEFANYLSSFPVEVYRQSPLLVSAGNFIGGSPWNVRATDEITPFLLRYMLRFDVGNVGDLELAMGPDFLAKADRTFNYISSNIFWAAARDGATVEGATVAEAEETAAERSTEGPRDIAGPRVTAEGKESLVWPEYYLTTVESAASGTTLKPLRVALFGLMTEDTVATLHPDVVALYDVRTDFDETYRQINDRCGSLKAETRGTQCILLVSGGINPNFAEYPEREIEQNETEFARIVNTFTHFDGFVGSRTMVEATIHLPNRRWVIQSLPRGMNVGRVDLSRPSRIPLYPEALVSLQPFGAGEDGVEDHWGDAWPLFIQSYLDQANDRSPNFEIGIFEGSVPVASNPELPSSSYTEESPIAVLIADAVAERLAADMAILEGNIAAFGLSGPDQENVLTSRHVEELLFRPETQTVTLSVTPAQLYRVFYQQWNAVSRLFRPLALSGVQVGYDFRRPIGTEIVSVHVKGAPVDPADNETTYTLVVSDYLRRGALGHTELARLPEHEEAATKSRLRSQKLPKTSVIADLFKAHVTEHPVVGAPAPRMLNSTVVIARDALIQVSYPLADTPSSPDVLFPLNLHFTAKNSVLSGPFNLYRRDTGENLGQIPAIDPKTPTVLPIQTYLGPQSQLVTFYMTDAQWIDQSYNRELAFAVSVPGLAVEDSDSSDDNDTTSTPKPSQSTAASAAKLNVNTAITLFTLLLSIAVHSDFF